MVYQASTTRYQTMEYRRCGRSGLQLPAISLGLWHNFGDETRVETSRQMLLHAFDLGINPISICPTTMAAAGLGGKQLWPHPERVAPALSR